MARQADWIAVDLDTTNLRAWVMDAEAGVLAQLTSYRSMGVLIPDTCERALMPLVGGYLDANRQTPLVACGMVGARQGWVEAPYASVPCPLPETERAVHAPTCDPRIVVHILPGLSQSSPADVMRGAETQIGGFLVAFPDFDGTMRLPGAYAKWVQISAGEIVSFHTFITGDLFAATLGNTVLGHSRSAGQDDAAFDAGVTEGIARRSGLARRRSGGPHRPCGGEPQS